jgi:hypothetical protein
LFGGFEVLVGGCCGGGVGEEAVEEVVAFVAAVAYAWGF